MGLCLNMLLSLLKRVYKMFEPAKYKHRKAFKGRNRGNAISGSSLSFGTYGLKATSNCRINTKHLESARKVIVRSLKRRGKLWIRLAPNVPVTRKPIDVRMGKGKGSLDQWVFRVKAGRIIFELEGVSMEYAKLALEKAAAKLPFHCTFVSNSYGGYCDQY